MNETRLSTDWPLAAALLSVLILNSCGKGVPPAQVPPEVVVAPVVGQRITDWNEYTGRFQAVDSVQVRPRASGYIEEVLYHEGQLVKKDDVLFTIDARPYKADYDRAAAGVALAKAQNELAGIEAARFEHLITSGSVSTEERDRRVSLQSQSKAQVAAAQAELDAAALMLSFTKVLAPVDGRASRAEVTRGNLVTGGNEGGTLLTTIVSIDPIYVYFEGDEHAFLQYQANVRAGGIVSPRDTTTPVRVGLANEEGFPHEGHIDFIDNQLDVGTGTIRARAVLDNKARFFTPGLFARVQLLSSGEYDAVLIDDRAVGTDQNQRYVLVLGKENTIEYRAVELGRLVDGLRVVRSGLKPGDVVVTSGLQRVRPGIKVTPVMSTMAAHATVAAAPAENAVPVPAK